jgi:hypothetical protein
MSKFLGLAAAVAFALLAICSADAQAQPSAGSSPVPVVHLYRVTLVQAAPGKLTGLIALYKQDFAAESAAGGEAPLWMRHSQGDHWDLMILQPIATRDYFSPDRISSRSAAAAKLRDSIAWQEDLYCEGPPVPKLRKAFVDGGFFHVEMFVALPGHFQDLNTERQMENAYARALKQPENFIFYRESGAAWDLFTIGVFRDLKHYAESANLTPEQQDAAAKAAGFDSASQIGPYLRRFISTHHDTLAVAIK